MKKLLEKYQMLLRKIARSEIPEDKKGYMVSLPKVIIDKNLEEINNYIEDSDFVYMICDNVNKIFSTFEQAYDYLEEDEVFVKIVNEFYDVKYKGKTVRYIKELEDNVTKFELFNGLYITKRKVIE